MGLNLFKRKKNNRPMYVLSAAIIVAAVIIAVPMALIFMKPFTPPNQNNQTGNNTGIAFGSNPVLGNANAKVTIVEFSEYLCPFCGRFARDTLPLIKANYIDTGKVKFYFRDFIVHSAAKLASEASKCARDQGKYWEYGEVLFNNQSALTSEDLKAYAATLGLNTAQFNACLDSGKYAAEVDKDTSDGEAYGVTGTPTFFINGDKLVGAQPYATFQQAIEEALKAY
jgi:protein-disulfide isomerase